MPRRRSAQQQSYRHSDAVAAAEADALAQYRRTPRQRQVRLLLASLEAARVTLGDENLQRLACELGAGDEVRKGLGWIETAINRLQGD